MAETLKSRKHEIDRDLKLVADQTEALRSSFLPLNLSTERRAAPRAVLAICWRPLS